MSDTEGEDNPAFTNDDECPSPSALENSNTESLQQEERANNSSIKDHNSKCVEPSNSENANRDKSFPVQQPVEALRNGVSETNSYKTETRIELPADGEAKKSVPSPHGNGKVNGVNGNGNNNDASFLNTSTTTIQTNDGKKEQVEAVNLELVSMRPYTGNNLQTKGQEACEVPTDPYEEYFVPVNEHRKYMSSPNAEVETTVAGVRFDLGPGVGREGLSLRDPAAGLVDYSHWLNALRGEKLYVTKDKRSRSSYWRRTACWGCGLLVLAIALIIAILAGTGVILTQEATQPLESKGRMSSQTFEEDRAAGSQEYGENPPTSPSPVSSTFPPWRTTDETNLATVPEALDGIMMLDNFAWSDDLGDPKSRVYREVEAELEKHLRKMLDPSTNDKTGIKVYNISDNGEVMFRISYPPKITIEKTRDDLTEALRNNGNAIGRYHVGRLNVKLLIDECQYNNLNCSDTCNYDYAKSEFACACLSGRIFDGTQNRCVPTSDLSYVDMERNTPEPSTESAKDMVQGRSRAPESAFDPRRSDDWIHEHSIAVTESVDQTPDAKLQTSAEPRSESASESLAEPKSEPETSTKSSSEPEASTEYSAEPEASTEHSAESESPAEPQANIEPSAEPNSQPEPSANPNSESEPATEPNAVPELSEDPKSEPEPSADPKSEPEPSADPKSEPEPSADPKSEPEPSADPESEPEPSAEPKSEPEPSVDPKSEPEPSADPKSEPEPSADPKSEPEPSADPESEPEPSADPKSEPEPSADPKSEPEPSADPESEPEPSAEPKSEPEPSVDPKSEPEPSADPKSEPEPSADPKSEPEPSADPESEPEPSAEPKSEPEPSVDPKSEPEPSADPKSEPEPSADPESEPEPSADPKSEPEPSADPKSEPEPSADPKSEPEPSADPESEPEPSADPKSEPEPSADPKSEPEPSADPKSEPEPSADPKSEPESSADPESESEPSADPKSEPEPSADPKSEPEPSIDPKSEPKPTAEPETLSVRTLESELPAKSNGTLNTSVEVDGTPEPSAEPETVSEPTGASESPLDSKPMPGPSEKSDTEPETPTVEGLESAFPGEPKSEPEPSVESESSMTSELHTSSSVEPESASVSEEYPIVPESEVESTATRESSANRKTEPEAFEKSKSTTEPAMETESSRDSKSKPEPTVKTESSPDLKSVVEASTMSSLDRDINSKNNTDSLSALDSIDSDKITEEKSDVKPTIEPAIALVEADEPVTEPVSSISFNSSTSSTETTSESDASAESLSDESYPSNARSNEENTPKGEPGNPTDSPDETSSEYDYSSQSSTAETNESVKSSESAETKESQVITGASPVEGLSEPSTVFPQSAMTTNPSESRNPSSVDEFVGNEGPSMKNGTERAANDTRFEPRFDSTEDVTKAEPEITSDITTTRLIPQSPAEMDESTTASSGNNENDDRPINEAPFDWMHENSSDANLFGVTTTKIPSVIEPMTSSTISDGEEHIMLIPVIPERDNVRFTESDSSLSTLTNGSFSTNDQTSDKNSTLSSATSGISKSSENATVHPTEEKHPEDMSPFLPDIVKEKEVPKRLDKDEQDFPNPFDHHVEDAVLYDPHRHNHEETFNATNGSSIIDIDEIETSVVINKDRSANGVRSNSTTNEDKSVQGEASTMPNLRANATSDPSGQGTIDDFSKDERKLIDAVNNDDPRYSPESRNTLNENEATNDDLKLPEIIESVTSTTESPKNHKTYNDFEESKKSVPKKSSSDSTPPPKDFIPKIQPLENMEPEVETAMPELQKFTTEAILVENLTTPSTPVMTMTPSLASVTNEEYQTIATEQNAVEDQYNDIGDERIFKNSPGGDGFPRRGETSIESSFESKTTSERERITEPAGVASITAKSTNDSAVTITETTTSPNDLGTPTIEDSSETKTTTESSKFNAQNEKPSEEMNSTLTTENSIIPMEVLLDTATTETSIKIETVTSSGQETSIQDSTSKSKEPTSESTISTTIQAASAETKTTTQVPTMPDELRTTEHDFSTATPASPMSTLADSVDKSENEVSSSSNILTTENMSSVAAATVVTETYSQTWKINETIHTDSTILETTDKNEFESIERATPTESITATPSDIKPVSEIVLDDPEPIEFDYKQLFTTTEQPATRNIGVEDDDAALRVISLEENSEFENIQVPTTLRSISEGETSTTEKTTSQPEIVSPTVPTFRLTDTEGNIVVGQPNIKIVEVTSVSDQPGVMNDQESEPRTMTAPTDVPTESPTPQVRQHPIIIPVYEEIVEDVQDPRIHPIIYGIENTTPMEDIENNRNATQATTPSTKSQSVNPDLPITTGDMTNPPKEASLVQAEKTASILETKEQANETANTVPKVIAPSDQSAVSSIPVGILYSKCTTGQFQCFNGTSRDGAYCVSSSAKCDSERDCSDGSDEANCEEEHCLNNFQCRSGQCLARHLVCNGIKDCGDGSDETECNEWSCNFDEFQCPNGRCIPDLWRCDGRPDCEDHRDEYSCSESCGNDEYLCQTEKWCIPQTWRCNGVSECASGEDEKLCDCSLEQFKCKTGGCISGEQVCDGIEHCPDRSDEWNCLTDNLTIALNGSASDDGETVGLLAQATLLKIRQANNDRRLVCSDDWSDELSDAYCRSLGFSGAESTQMIVHEGGQKVLKLKLNAVTEISLVSKLEPVDMCDSGKVVEISCREFTCGAHGTERPTARLVGGTTAGEGQWSSVALLREVKHGVACTASVLGPMHALASYSCIHRFRQSTSWELFTGRDLQKSTRVKTIIPYPQVKYNQFLYSDDIALVELAEPLVFSRNVSAVCLPSRPFQPRALCVTAGWGFPTNGEVNLKQYLKFLPVPIYESEKCNATSHYAGFITKDNICAGFTDADKGSCYNDEGAPLMCATENGRWEIQGLLSHHSRCSRVHPAIYSSLSPALSWLRNSVPALQIQT